MNLRRTWAISRKEFIHIVRDWRSMGMAVALPMLMLTLFGYALTLDVDHVPMAIWDQSNTPESRDLIQRFVGGRYFAVQSYVDNYPAVESAIDKSQALVGLIIPVDFDRQIKSDRQAAIQLIVDGSDSNTATIAIGYASTVTASYDSDLQIDRIMRHGQTRQAIPIDIRPRVWFNIELESKNFIVPGLIAVIMMIITALLTSLTVAREWERGTMEQLVSTPVKPAELIIGKLIPYFAIGMVDVTISVLVGAFIFQVPFRGSVPLLFLLAAIFLIGALSLGLFISTLFRNQFMASQLAILVTFIPSYLLSGFMFAIPNMPKAIQVFTYLVPARYAIYLFKGIYLKGVGLEILWMEAMLLVIFSGAAVGLSILRFKKKLS